MVPDQNKTSLGLEYFCSEGDEVWNMPDADLIELGNVKWNGSVWRTADIEGGCVFRVPKSYPVYDSGYRESLSTLRSFVEAWKIFRPSAVTGYIGTIIKTTQCLRACSRCATLFLAKTMICGA